MYDELKKLAENATPGPWGYDGSYVCPSRVEGGTTYVESWKSVADCHQPENTKFIAAANPSAVLALIEEIERVNAAWHEMKIALDQLKADNEVARMRIKELDLLFGRYILAMRAAVIEENAEKGMEWIYNSLAGPGELPPEDATDAQAYFDREIIAVEKGMDEVLAFHDARRKAKEAAK